MVVANVFLGDIDGLLSIDPPERLFLWVGPKIHPWLRPGDARRQLFNEADRGHAERVRLYFEVGPKGHTVRRLVVVNVAVHFNCSKPRFVHEGVLIDELRQIIDAAILSFPVPEVILRQVDWPSSIDKGRNCPRLM